MQVERGLTDFPPIVITIKSVEEAELMWHALNAPVEVLEKESGQTFTQSVHTAMWGAFNAQFRPASRSQKKGGRKCKQ